jgi:hypothetical protein
MAAAVAGCALAACGSSEEGAAAGEGPAPASGATAGAGGDGGASSGIGGDLFATGTGAGGTSASGCEKVDFLFVVDNSVSMQDQQAALVASFPGFLAAIQTTLSAKSDYHIMVVDTDAWGRCNTANPWTGIDPGSTTCNSYIKTTVFEECDRVIGAGVVHPAGQYASNKPCAFASGKRYLAEGDADLAGTFGCAALVGVAGHSSERPMDAMVAAVSAGLNASGGCNHGFLREDAILVVTFISDDPNYEDAGTAADWYQAVLAAKAGNAKAVVVLGLTPNFPGCQNGKGPPKGAHWSEFIALWADHGLEASVCNADYTPFFAEAVAIIDDACDEFEPPK